MESTWPSLAPSAGWPEALAATAAWGRAAWAKGCSQESGLLTLALLLSHLWDFSWALVSQSPRISPVTLVPPSTKGTVPDAYPWVLRGDS